VNLWKFLKKILQMLKQDEEPGLLFCFQYGFCQLQLVLLSFFMGRESKQEIPHAPPWGFLALYYITIE